MVIRRATLWPGLMAAMLAAPCALGTGRRGAGRVEETYRD